MPGILKAFGVKLPARQRVSGLLSHFSRKPRKSTAPAKPRTRLWRFLPLIPLSVIAFTVLCMSSPINAAAWKPDPVPAWTGALAPNAELGDAERLGLDHLAHPEDMAFDGNGRIYTGSDDGNIYRITLDGGGAVRAFDTFAAVGGDPLGLAFDTAGNLIAAVKDVGLLSLDPRGTARLLTNSVDNTPITYANAVAITADGTVYFSDSSVKYDRGWPYDVLEARPNGRLLAYFPDTHTTTVVKDNLYFPNGLVLAPSGEFLLVNESTRFRIARYWLIGPQQGTWEYFAENLPVLPDNISVDEAGNYLVGGTGRIGMIDRLQSHAALKNQLAKIPGAVLQKVPTLPWNRYGLVLILSSNGSIKRSLHDPTGNIFAVSSARSQHGYIYIGTLFGSDLARYPYQP
jgi:sugar lactone lactonase YvrE